jgi:hypothetical protein
MLAGEKQHLICLGPAGLEGLLEESVALIAKDSQVTIHVIALPDHARAAELRTLAESTGGYFVVAPDTAGIPQLCEAIYTALRHRHHLRWLGTSNCFTVRLCEGPRHAIAHWPDDQHRVTSQGDNSSAGRLPQTGFSFETEIDRNGASDDCGCSAAGPDFPSTL